MVTWLVSKKNPVV